MSQQTAERFSHFAARPPCRDPTVRRSVEGGPRPLATGTGSVTDSNVTEKESGFYATTEERRREQGAYSYLYASFLTLLLPKVHVRRWEVGGGRCQFFLRVPKALPATASPSSSPPLSHSQKSKRERKKQVGGGRWEVGGGFGRRGLCNYPLLHYTPHLPHYTHKSKRENHR